MTTFGGRARELMAAQGISLRELARRTFYDKAHISRVLNGQKRPSVDLATAVDAALGANGALITAVQADSALAQVITPDEADRLAYVSHTPRRVDSAALDSLAVVLAESRRLEDALGASAVLDTARSHLQLVERLVVESCGALRPGVVDLGAQWAQFNGWLHAATHRLPAADRMFSRTLEWAIEADNVTLQANALTFKGNLAWIAGKVGSVIGLSRAAQRDPGVYTGQRAFAAMQEARGHAAAGDVDAATRRMDHAAVLADQLEHAGDPPPWNYDTPALITLERGLVNQHLGRQQLAADLLASGLDELPADQREAEWTAPYRHALDRAQQAL